MMELVTFHDIRNPIADLSEKVYRFQRGAGLEE